MNRLILEKISDPGTYAGALFLILVLGLPAWGAALITPRLMKRLHWVIRESNPEPFAGLLFYPEPGMLTLLSIIIFYLYFQVLMVKTHCSLYYLVMSGLF
jgi:hypothetical protein